MTDLKVADLKEEGNPQIYAINASGVGNSNLRIIKQGLKVKQLNAIPSHEPHDIWCLKKSHSEEHDSMIIISMANKNKTLVLTAT